MKEKFLVPHNKQILLIHFEKIMFFKADNSYTDLHLTDESRFVLCKSLSQVEIEINSPTFLRIHQSYLINKEKISLIDKENKTVKMENGLMLPFTLKVKELINNL